MRKSTKASSGWKLLAATALFGIALGSADEAQAWGGPPPPCNVGRNQVGDDAGGKRVDYWRPSQSGQRPVVVYLHGFSLPSWEIYRPHIESLVAAGYAVVFPQFNIVPTFFDLNQYSMLDRAIDSVDLALAACDAYYDENNVTLFGHSLGGNMAAAWQARGGQPAQRVFLANPSTDAGFVGFITTQLNHEQMAPQTTGKVMILTGAQDTIAAPSQSTHLYDIMVNASSRVVYQANSSSGLAADHMAPIQDDGWAPGWMMDIFGGQGTNDALDSQYYWHAMTRLLTGYTTASFPSQSGWYPTTLRSCAGSCY